MSTGHLPVRSYLAVPVKTPTGDVLGGLFFSHSQAGVFTEQHEQLTSGIAAWASLALENARRTSPLVSRTD
jgi:GAF domain-containing protein